jgi:hypothetical protein
MKRVNHFAPILLLMVFGVSATTASAAPIAYVSLPTATNGSSSIQSGTTYTTNLGYAFKTGSSGPFDIDWIMLELTSGATSGSGTFNISINGTDNETPLSAVASGTVYAADTVSFTTPGTANTPFNLALAAADLPNISAYSLLPNTAYSLFVNSAAGSSVALRRIQGLTSGSAANAAYAVTNGFTMLDTFRNNIPNYANSQGPPVSYAVFAMSFGFEAVPEPSTCASLLGGLAFGCHTMFRRRKRA